MTSAIRPQLFYSHESLETRALEIAAGLSTRAVYREGFDGFSFKQLEMALSAWEHDSQERFFLLLHPEGLELFDRVLRVKVKADFHGGTVAYRLDKGGGLNQMIAKAVGVKGGTLSVLDATAGLGGDALVLASLGCTVSLAERNPVVRALLREAHEQACQYAQTMAHANLSGSLSRMELLPGNALEAFMEIERPDVVYLDPMFPKRTKQSLVKKEMQVLQALVGEDMDADALLEPALNCARKRVVVKRPRIAPDLAGKQPSHSLVGKSNRFDVYMVV